MKLIKTLLLLLILSITLLNAQQKQVCFSIDDLPVVNYGINTPEFHIQITEKLLSGLKKNEIQAIGFVNEGKMYDAKGKVIFFQKENLEKWLKYGMDLGNHTLRHKDSCCAKPIAFVRAYFQLCEGYCLRMCVKRVSPADNASKIE